MIRMHSRKLISDKGWQLSNYGSSDNDYGLGFCVFMPHMVFGFLVCKGKDCISRIHCFACFVCFLLSLYIVICLNSLNKFRHHYLRFPMLPWPCFRPHLRFATSAPPPHPSPHHACLNCYSIRIKESRVLNTGLIRVDVSTALQTQH
jgi:hypothetical protein